MQRNENFFKRYEEAVISDKQNFKSKKTVNVFGLFTLQKRIKSQAISIRQVPALNPLPALGVLPLSVMQLQFGLFGLAVEKQLT